MASTRTSRVAAAVGIVPGAGSGGRLCRVVACGKSTACVVMEVIHPSIGCVGGGRIIITHTPCRGVEVINRRRVAWGEVAGRHLNMQPIGGGGSIGGSSLPTQDAAATNTNEDNEG